MYHPYFRGKQYELITVRETAPLLAAADFVPIIEPVKEGLGGLERTLQAVCDEEGSAIVIVNPHHGVHADDGQNISELLKTTFGDHSGITAGVLLKEDMDVAGAIECCKEHEAHTRALIHAGFADAKGLADALGDDGNKIKHVFFEPACGKLYRRHFSGADRVLIRDGFKRRRNRDHPSVEPFSDLHVTFEDEGMNGFGDFLIVGDDYSESGGPAYAVAIHLTFIDPTKDNEMFIYHFVSKSTDTPTDPAGKFGEALDRLMKRLAQPNHHIFESTAVKDFRDLHKVPYRPVEQVGEATSRTHAREPVLSGYRSRLGSSRRAARAATGLPSSKRVAPRAPSDNRHSIRPHGDGSAAAPHRLTRQGQPRRHSLSVSWLNTRNGGG